METRLRKRRLLSGWLAREGQDWLVRSRNREITEGTVLWVASPSAWLAVGSVAKDGRITVTGGSAATFEGRPLFVERENPIVAR
jgi:hypothetical protein